MTLGNRFKEKIILIKNAVLTRKQNTQSKVVSSYDVTPAKRLLKKPVFIISSVRSGSTLLSSILDANPKVYSPHETHFSRWRVQEVSQDNARLALKTMKVDEAELTHQLWDAALSNQLGSSKKKILVEKTPYNALIWEEILRCWPDAKFIILLRHPASIAASWKEAKKKLTEQEAYDFVLKYMHGVEEARIALGKNSFVIKYEDITSTPEQTLRKLCNFLDITYSSDMINYGEKVNTKKRYKRGINDWSGKIKSGTIQSGRPLPDDNSIPATLREIAVKWGYIQL